VETAATIADCGLRTPPAQGSPLVKGGTTEILRSCPAVQGGAAACENLTHPPITAKNRLAIYSSFTLTLLRRPLTLLRRPLTLLRRPLTLLRRPPTLLRRPPTLLRRRRPCCDDRRPCCDEPLTLLRRPLTLLRRPLTLLRTTADPVATTADPVTTTADPRKTTEDARVTSPYPARRRRDRREMILHPASLARGLGMPDPH
jgi:hypothetical protein